MPSSRSRLSFALRSESRSEGSGSGTSFTPRSLLAAREQGSQIRREPEDGLVADGVLGDRKPVAVGSPPGDGWAGRLARELLLRLGVVVVDPQQLGGRLPDRLAHGPPVLADRIAAKQEEVPSLGGNDASRI